MVGIIANVAALVVTILTRQDTMTIVWSAVGLLNCLYFSLLGIGALTTISEWKRIYAPTWKKIVFTLTFPLFMFTFIPCTVAGICAREVTWKPIEHTRAASLSEIREGSRKTA